MHVFDSGLCLFGRSAQVSLDSGVSVSCSFPVNLHAGYTKRGVQSYLKAVFIVQLREHHQRVVSILETEDASAL
jgi:hypothetical protein